MIRPRSLLVPPPLRALLVVLTAALAALVTGCGAPATAPDSLAFDDSDEQVTLTLWVWEGTIDESIIADFERENPTIDVSIRYSGFDQHHTALRSAMDIGEDVPDVAAVEVGYLADFIAGPDDFVDLREYGADDVAGEYLDWRWAHGVAESGSVIGLPTDVGGLAFAYRRDLFAAAGLPDDPETVSERFATWDDFLRFGEEFSSATPDTEFLDSISSLFYARLGQGPVGYTDIDGFLALETSPTLREAWDLTIAAEEAGLIADLDQFSPEWNEAMANDGFAVVAAPSWMRRYIESKSPDTAGSWGLAPIPGLSGNWGGSQLTVPAEAEYPEEAWRLIRHLTDANGQAELFQRSGNFPSVPVLYEDESISELTDPFFDDQNVGRIYIDSLLDVYPRRTVENQRGLDRAFIFGLQGHAREGLSPTEAWERALTEAMEQDG